MQQAEHYETDMWLFFDGKPLERSLYERLYKKLDTAIPEASVKVQKSQISFYGRHLFAAVSLPLRRKKEWPKACILVTLGLSHRLDAPRIAVATEPYPGRWTHHIVISREEELDDQLMGWLQEAYDFSQSKRPAGRRRI